MENLSLNLGLKKIRLQIDNNPNRVFEFCPDDSAVSAKFLCVCDNVLAYRKELEKQSAEIDKMDDIVDENGIPSKQRAATELEKELDEQLRSDFDSVFGGGSADTVFGSIGLTSPATTEDGTETIVFDVVLRQLLPYFESSSKKRVEKYTKRVKNARAAKRG